MSNAETLKEIDSKLFRTDLPEINVGDQLELTISKSTKNTEKGSILFRGTVISTRNKNSLNYAFTMIKETSKLVVNVIFFYHLTPIIKIKKIVAKKIHVRRAKLYYLERALIKKKQGE